MARENGAQVRPICYWCWKLEWEYCMHSTVLRTTSKSLPTSKTVPSAIVDGGLSIINVVSARRTPNTQAANRVLVLWTGLKEKLQNRLNVHLYLICSLRGRAQHGITLR